MKVPPTEAKLALILALLFASSGYAKKKDFVSLFNGKDLEQWILPKGEHAWKIIDGVIDYESKGGNLTTQKSFSDYALVGLAVQENRRPALQRENLRSRREPKGRRQRKANDAACQKCGLGNLRSRKWQISSQPVVLALRIGTALGLP